VSLAIRIAQSMDMDKDGSKLGLSPFETEMRRRVWWHLILLNIRTSEGYSSDLFIAKGSAVKLPANVEDDEMDPNSSQRSVEREGLTEMTASLLRYEAIAAVADATRPSKVGGTTSETNFAERIAQFEQTLETKYLGPARADADNERSRLILALGKIAVLKLCWVWGFSLMKQNGQTPQLTTDMSNLSDELFITATKMLEQQVLLHTEPSLKNLYWFLRNIKPWDGVAILLAQMRVRLQKLYPGKSYDELPQMLKDAWEVSARAVTRTKYWQVDQKFIDGLEKMRRQTGEMMGLQMDAPTPTTQILAALSDEFGPLPIMNETDFDGMDLDHFIAQDDQNCFSDPWPMFIPMNFNYFGGAPL
jgi:hypothetical protein